MRFLDRVWPWSPPNGDHGVATFAATYVINLRDSTARWEAMTEVLQRTRLPHVIRWAAIDGRRLDDDCVRTLQSIGTLAEDLSKFTPNAVKEEIGCALSHLGVLTDIVRRGLRSALILEDDVVPTGSDDDWHRRFARAYADLPRAWDVWFLYRCLDRKDQTKRRTPRTLVPYLPYGAAAYAVSRCGAEKLSRAALPLYQPIDCIVAEDLVREGRISAYAASPRLFQPGNHKSIINANNPEKDFMVDGVSHPPEFR
jgi:GR25 family glycosyltransferase involved in LPS biosynthesis